MFRRLTSGERRWVQDLVEALRSAAFKTVKGLRSELDWAEGMSRAQFEDLLTAMVRSGLIEIEDAEFEKDGKVIAYRKISLTDAGSELRANAPVELLISDGVVEEFGKKPAAMAPRIAKGAARPASGKPAPTRKADAAVVQLTPESQALAGRLRECRAAEAKRLRLPAYMVLQDRTLAVLAQVRPMNRNQLLTIEGIGSAKVEKFGDAILGLCGGAD